MAIMLNRADPDFEIRFAAFLSTKREVSPDVEAAVKAIIAEVRERGDAALIDYTRKFDRADLGQRVLHMRGHDLQVFLVEGDELQLIHCVEASAILVVSV